MSYLLFVCDSSLLSFPINKYMVSFVMTFIGEVDEKSSRQLSVPVWDNTICDYSIKWLPTKRRGVLEMWTETAQVTHKMEQHVSYDDIEILRKICSRWSRTAHSKRRSVDPKSYRFANRFCRTRARFGFSEAQQIRLESAFRRDQIMSAELGPLRIGHAALKQWPRSKIK
jgi:hypothetical protein